MDLADVLLWHVRVVILEIIAHRLDQLHVMNRELVDERHDLPANSVMPFLCLVVTCRLEVLSDGAVGDGDRPALRILLEPANELPQPAVIIVERPAFATDTNL